MFYADLSPVVGSEQGGIRPVLIIQNDVGNKYSPTVIAAAITSQTNKTKIPTHIEIDSQKCGLKSDSVILAEQIRTIDKSRLKEKIGHIEDESIRQFYPGLRVPAIQVRPGCLRHEAVSDIDLRDWRRFAGCGPVSDAVGAAEEAASVKTEVGRLVAGYGTGPAVAITE